MRVVYFVPGQSIRMTGGLGPLQANGVAGSFSLDLAKGKTGTTLTLTYRVGGYIPGGAQALAAPVDGVLGQQFKRLTNLIERGSPTQELKN